MLLLHNPLRIPEFVGSCLHIPVNFIEVICQVILPPQSCVRVLWPDRLNC